MPVLAPGDYISIIGASYSAIRALITAVESIKNAPTEIEEIKREAALVAHLLDTICAPDSNPEVQVTVLWPVLVEMAEKVHEEAKAFVEKVMQKGKMSRGRRILWPLYASDAKALAKRLREFHGTVGAAYSIRSFQELRSVTVAYIAPTLRAVQATDGRAANREQVAIQVASSSRATSSPLHGDKRVTGITKPRCPKTCGCRCHQPLRRLVPAAAQSVLGDIRASPMHLATAILSAACPCDDPLCVEMRAAVAIVKWYLPWRWAEIDATLRLQWCPVQIIIQTPRIVHAIRVHTGLTLDKLMSKMARREVTVNDVDKDGISLLHYLMVIAVKCDDINDVCGMIQYVIERGARTDWECKGWTPVQSCLYLHELEDEPDGRDLGVLERTVFRPLFDVRADELWEDICNSQSWTDLHTVIVKRRTCPATLAELLQQPRYRSQLNTRNRRGWGPLLSTFNFRLADALEVLLRAGADPRSNCANVCHAVHHYSSVNSISPLIRAGADIDDHHEHLSPLHSALDKGSKYALAVLRHGSHLVDWEYRDRNGRTPLDAAKHWMGEWYWTKDLRFCAELYQARKLQIDAQFVDKDYLLGAAEAVVNLKSTSVIAAGLDGNFLAIGELIRLGAMVNERDHAGRTLLHLVAMGVVSNGYRIAVEVVRHGGYGVHWTALTNDGRTAEDLAEETVRVLEQSDTSSDDARAEAAKILELIRNRRLPDGEAYIYPCMHLKYCRRCCSHPCTGSHPRPERSLWEVECQCGCAYDGMDGDAEEEQKMPGAYVF